MRLAQMPDSSPSTKSSGAPGSPRRAAQMRAAETLREAIEESRSSEIEGAAEAAVAEGAAAPSREERRAGEAVLAASASGGAHRGGA